MNEFQVEDLTLRRDFESGTLFATYTAYLGYRRGKYSQIIREPLSDKDRAFIGDTPIPPNLAKVDL